MGSPRKVGPRGGNRVRQAAAVGPHRPLQRPVDGRVLDCWARLGPTIKRSSLWWQRRGTRPQATRFQNTPGLRTAYVSAMTLISAREAARRLEATGVGRRRTRQLLQCGVAGQPTAAGGALLYDADRVEALCAWPSLSLDDIDEVCPRGVFLARRYVSCQLPTAELDREWGGDWALSPLTAISLRLTIERDGYFPFVGAVCGLVTFGADVTVVRPETRSTYRLTFAPPGEWFESIREHRVTAPGGKTFMVRGWPPPPPPPSRPAVPRSSSAAPPSTAPLGSRAAR